MDFTFPPGVEKLPIALMNSANSVHLDLIALEFYGTSVQTFLVAA